jgi:hypothetical protein
MYATAIVGGKVVKFALPTALAKAHRRNPGRTMTDQQAVDFVEAKRRQLALRRAKPYLEGRSEFQVARGTAAMPRWFGGP